MRSDHPQNLTEAIEVLSKLLNLVPWREQQSHPELSPRIRPLDECSATTTPPDAASPHDAHATAAGLGSQGADAPTPPPGLPRAPLVFAAESLRALGSWVGTLSRGPVPARAVRLAGPIFKFSAPSLAYYRRTHPTVPSQQAADGALAIYLEGWARKSARQMLFGLSVLRDASVAQVDSAIATLGARQIASEAEIRAMLRAEHPGESLSSP